MYTFTNQFGGHSLRQRVKMMNSHRSGIVSGWRYLVWAVVISAMALACRVKHDQNDFIPNQKNSSHILPATNPARAKVVELEDQGTWYQHLALYQTRMSTRIVQSEPVVLQVKGDQFLIPDDYKYASAVYIDGKAVSVDALRKLSPAFVKEVFVMHQWENLPNADPKAKPFQVLIQTSPQPVQLNYKRNQFFTLLRAAAISQHPLGETFSFSMNQLLEATFFHNKNALVERTKDEHLKIYDEYTNAVEIFINRLPATPADVKTVHVREVARLYTKELPYSEWFRADNPLPRFRLFIQTSPKRAKRDSSYYVFSPFYTGDF